MVRAARRSSAAFVLTLVTLLSSAFPNDDRVVPRQPGTRDACPVCGMLVAPHPGWLAQAVLADGRVVFFDGCKDLFTFLLDPQRYDAAARPAAFTAVFVTSYYDQTPIPASEAFFVANSDVYGPMGAELVPLRALDEAEEFARDHGGTAILRFDEVDAMVLSGLR